MPLTCNILVSISVQERHLLSINLMLCFKGQTIFHMFHQDLKKYWMWYSWHDMGQLVDWRDDCLRGPDIWCPHVLGTAPPPLAQATPPCYHPVVPTLGAPGPELWTGLLTVTCYLSLGSGDYVWPGQRETMAAPSWWREESVLTGSPPLNPHRLNVTSGWPDLYLPADLVTLLISFWERSSFLDRRFQCGSHVWCTVIILD